MRRSAEKERAKFARSADELVQLHGIEKSGRSRNLRFLARGFRGTEFP